MYPYENYSIQPYQYEYPSQAPQEYFDSGRQAPQFFQFPQWQQLERRVTQLERQNERQERDIAQLQRRLLRVNQRLRAVENRLQIPFTPFEGGF